MPVKAKLSWNMDFQGMQSLMRKHADDSVVRVADAITKASERGAEAVKQKAILQGSPTGSRWHININEQRGNSFGARVESGTMLNAVGYERADQISFGVVQGSYGLPLNGPEYFFEQDEGYTFTTWSGNQSSPPGMNTYEKSKEAMVSELKAQMRSAGFKLQ